ncbi:MAG: RIP metalloprotease RseP, partial [Bdellovibrionales bacterium]|nr:RIP metalloprotease RseP [Bdellovibrionales bacterium]
MNSIIEFFHSAFITVGPFFILLGLLIFVHELGHFAVAKFFGVRVETFSMGFGKKIFQFKRGDTTYCISLIPLGGYVKMYGDDPTAEVPEGEKKYSFLHKPIYQRFAIVLAGPLMNLFFAGVLFSGIALVGQEVPSTQLGDVLPTSIAAEAGFQSGDTIQSINGDAVETWLQVQTKIQNAINQPLAFKVKRADSGELAEITSTPRPGENPNILSVDGLVGEIPGLTLESRASLIGVSDPKGAAA